MIVPSRAPETAFFLIVLLLIQTALKHTTLLDTILK